LVDYGRLTDALDGVEIDNAAGGYQAVEWLVRRGHKRIGYLGCWRTKAHDEWPNSVSRREGYRAALRAAGLEIVPAYERLTWAAFDYGRRAVAELLSLTNPPTAWVTFAKPQGAGAVAAARAHGLAAPGTFDVVSFTDTIAETAEEAGFAAFNLVPWRVIGQAAARLTLRRLHDPRSGIEHIVIRPEFREAPILGS
jgi:LacI family transcriptional regulator, repressor for deo operon, udp, cdd, tsx, nupC, and nupG